MKIIKNLKNMNEDKKSGFFSYWSCVCYTAFVTYLRKYYKMVNGKRKVLLLALEHSQRVFPNQHDLIKNLKRTILSYEVKGEQYETK